MSAPQQMVHDIILLFRISPTQTMNVTVLLIYAFLDTKSPLSTS